MRKEGPEIDGELEFGAKQELFNRLDECLRERAAEYMEPKDKSGLPFIQNIYYLQGYTEIHTYLKTVHEFTPGEVNDLLMFADPLQVAHHCWEENPDKYCLRISGLIDSLNLRDIYPPVDFDIQDNAKKPSLREQLQKAKKEIARGLRDQPPEKGNRGGDAR